MLMFLFVRGLPMLGSLLESIKSEKSIFILRSTIPDELMLGVNEIEFFAQISSWFLNP